MKKKVTAETTEMVSLNESFFSIETGNLSVEELDQRLELAVAIAIGDMFNCGGFTCENFESCETFTCSNFAVK